MMTPNFRMPNFGMNGSGWRAVWTFIAILAAIRTLGELFRHGWSDIVLLGLFCVTVSAVFALVAERRRASLGIEGRSGPEGQQAAALRRRAADPILPGRRFF